MKMQPTGIQSCLLAFRDYSKAYFIHLVIYYSGIQNSQSLSNCMLLQERINIQVNKIYTNMEEEYLDFKKYISVASSLAFIASRFVKQCSENPNLKKYEKQKNDPVTQADFKVQTLIINGLRHFFPKIKIIGEESVDYQGQINVNYAQISSTNYPQSLQFNEKALLSQFCVWIDPIDNTKGFIDGTLDCVTVLIGLSRNKRSYIGVTALPYCKEDQKIIYRPEILLGIAPLFKAFSSFQSHKWMPMQKPKLHNPLKIVSRDTGKMTDSLKNAIKETEANIFFNGGSGKKISQVAKGQMDVLIYEGRCTHKWDSCASEPLILALGGFFTDEKCQPIEYDPNNVNTVNNHGNICCFDQIVHQNILSLLQKGRHL